MKDHCVLVKQLGANVSALNGFALVQHREYKAFHGDVLEILHNKYFHRIAFDPVPSTIEVKSETATQIPDKSSLKRTRTPVRPESGKKIKLTEPSASIDNSWKSVGSGKLLVFTAKGVTSSTKVICFVLNTTSWHVLTIFLTQIASFDIDGTIISTKSGNVFPKSPDDWQIGFPQVPATLKQLLKDGYKIVFFTNQGGIGTGKTNEAEWKVIKIC